MSPVETSLATVNMSPFQETTGAINESGTADPLVTSVDNRGLPMDLGTTDPPSVDNSFVDRDPTMDLGRTDPPGLREVFLNSSALDISGNRYRSPLGVTLQVAIVCSGCMYAHYFRTLCLSLGMSTVREPTFFKTLRVMFPHVEKLLSEQCEDAKQHMRSLGEATLGSFKKAVTTGDAAYLTRGHFSRNAT